MLAVYSPRSGIVGLGTLSVQYKHLTEAMTLYYRNNAVFAPNILVSDSQKEFIKALNKTIKSQLLNNERN